MKIILHLVVIAFSLFSCQKATKPAVDGGSLEGKWELSESYGGMIPYTKYAPGNGRLLEFDGSIYKCYVNHQLVQQGIYRTGNDSLVDQNTCGKVPAINALPNQIIYDNEPVGKTFFEIKANKLKIKSGCFPLDGGWSVYIRKSSAPRSN